MERAGRKTVGYGQTKSLMAVKTGEYAPVPEGTRPAVAAGQRYCGTEKAGRESSDGLSESPESIRCEKPGVHSEKDCIFRCTGRLSCKRTASPGTALSCVRILGASITLPDSAGTSDSHKRRASEAGRGAYGFTGGPGEKGWTGRHRKEAA